MSPFSKLTALVRGAMRGSVDGFRPAYDLGSLLRRIPLPSGADVPPSDAGFEAQLIARNSRDASNALARHFCLRRSPRFLYDGSTLHGKNGDLADEAKRWILLASDQVRAMTSVGLPVHGKAAPPLRPGFPWGGDWCAGEDDVLYGAHPHRFAFAPRLALASLGRTYSAKAFSAVLTDWMEFAGKRPQLPFISAFVVAQRLIASTCALHFVMAATGRDEAERENLCTRLLQIIGQDIDFLLPRVGKSYPNGHLLTDRFAAWFAATQYPEFCDGKIASEAAETAWLAELERQTYADGADFEHALQYQGLATEMATAYLLLKQRNGEAVPETVRERIHNMIRLQADLAGPDGTAPNIGDGTDDSMFPLDGGTGTTPAAMREICRRGIAGSIPPLASDHPANERAFWMLAASAAASGGTSDARGLSGYPLGGLFVFLDHDEATRCVFRTGPVQNTRTFAGHMHADMLSICLTCRGTPIVVDAGTYTYRWRPRTGPGNVPGWREYLAGPLAHNGMAIEGDDPLGPVAGDFRPGVSLAMVEHTNILEGTGVSLVEARMISPPSHAGLTRGVIHIRGEYFVVYGWADGGLAQAQLTYPLQFQHGARVTGDGSVLNVANLRGTDAAIVLSDGLALAESFLGSHDPVRGWVSPRYGQLRAAPQLVFRPTVPDRPAALAFCLNHAAPIQQVIGSRTGGSHLAFQITGHDFRDYIVLNARPSHTVISVFGIEFGGRLLWVRAYQAGRTEVRGVDVVSCMAPDLGLEPNSG